MDLSPPAPRPPSSPPVSSAHLSRTASASRAPGASGNDDIGSRLESNGALRRGHSDGDVLRSHLRGPGSSQPADDETWIDFLRGSSRPAEDVGVISRRHAFRALGAQDPARRQDRRAIMQRAALTLADRKRRLTENQEDHVRRRSASSLSFGPAMTAGGSGLPSTHLSESSFASLERHGGPTDSSINDRPLQRRSNVPTLGTRASQEITLPRWQPDSEVTSCPICGTSFGFWFRKHHCRKCGRVVCANCSPHRITIPRQFIVQPQQDLNQGSNIGTAADIEVVDLTDDNTSRSFDSPQSPVLRIDPALGGGQEVRLCNPCVPDPNPLPHLPVESPSRLGSNSFPRPEFSSHQTPSNHGPYPSHSDIPRGSSSTRHSFHLSGQTSIRTSGATPDDPNGVRPSDQQRPRPPGPPRYADRFPPSYQTAYGSVPERSLHDVSLLLFVIYIDVFRRV